MKLHKIIIFSPPMKNFTLSMSMNMHLTPPKTKSHPTHKEKLPTSPTTLITHPPRIIKKTNNKLLYRALTITPKSMKILSSSKNKPKILIIFKTFTLKIFSNPKKIISLHSIS
jgi:hypothetical protein